MFDQEQRSDVDTLKNHSFIRIKPKPDQMNVRDYLLFGYMKDYIDQASIRKIIINGNLRFETNKRANIN